MNLRIIKKISLTQYAIIYILLVGLICHVLEVPEIVKAFLALPGFIVIPFVCGNIVIDLVFNISKRYLEFIGILVESLDILSLCVLKWCLGSLILFTLATAVSYTHLTLPTKA